MDQPRPRTVYIEEPLAGLGSRVRYVTRDTCNGNLVCFWVILPTLVRWSERGLSWRGSRMLGSARAAWVGTAGWVAREWGIEIDPGEILELEQPGQFSMSFEIFEETNPCPV